MKKSDRGNMDGVMSKGYGTIPKLVMQDKDLTIEAKAIYAFLSSYTGAGNTAYPSVSFMCDCLNIGKDRFYKHRKLLIKKDYIRITKKQNEGGWANNIYTVVTMPHPQNTDTQNTDTQNADTQNADTINNSSINNSINNNSVNKDLSPEKPDKTTDAIPYKEITEYLNQKTGRSYKHSANKNQDLIKARWNEGFRVSDFKKVIDNKTADWGSDEKMSSYLRPLTLFSNKFDNYLNETPKQKKGGHDLSEYEQFF